MARQSLIQGCGYGSRFKNCIVSNRWGGTWINFEDITLISGDTDSTYFDVGIFSDRGTHTAGLAAKMAAMDAKSQIFDLATEELEADPDELYLHDGKIFVKGSQNR